MGQCIYCNESAGWFRKRHKACELLHKEATSDIATWTFQTATEGGSLRELAAKILARGQEGRVNDHARSTAIASGLAHLMNHYLEDHALSVDEEANVERLVSELPVDRTVLEELGLIEQVVKASLVRSLQEGTVPEPKMKWKADLPFLFQKSEKLLWVYPKVEYLERGTRTEYRGRSQGVSIRIVKGVYYRTGAFRGNPVEVETLKSFGTGVLAITTKHLYFGSEQKSLKVPYGKLVSINTYSDAVQVQKDGVTSKPQIFKGIDGWFVANIVSNCTEN